MYEGREQGRIKKKRMLRTSCIHFITTQQFSPSLGIYITHIEFEKNRFLSHLDIIMKYLWAIYGQKWLVLVYVWFLHYSQIIDSVFYGDRNQINILCYMVNLFIRTACYHIYYILSSSTCTFHLMVQVGCQTVLSYQTSRKDEERHVSSISRKFPESYI